MILLAIGLPGRFSAWCNDLIARLAGTGDTVAAMVWPSSEQLLRIASLPGVLDEIARALIAGSHQHLVVGVRQPDDRLFAALSDTGVHFLVALDDPRQAVADMLAESDAEFGLATRAVANCCFLAMRFASLPGALVLHGDRAFSDIAGTITAVAAHCGLAAGKRAIDRVAAAIAASDLTRALLARPPVATAFPEPAWRVVDGALASYAEQFGGGAFGQIVWRRELFILHADDFARPTGIIDLAGPPRTLVYGPYIHLLPGRWSARVTLGVSPDAAGNAFLVDAFADTRQLGHAVLVPEKGGVYAADIDFSLEQPSAKGLEIRVLVTNQNARGRLALGQVVLQPLAMRPPDAFSGAEDFESVLEW